MKKTLLFVLIFLTVAAFVSCGKQAAPAETETLPYDSETAEETEAKTEETEVEYDEGKTVKYGGRVYRLDEDMVFCLVMGIDRDEFASGADEVSGAGQSDANVVIGINSKTGRAKAIVIPRDTVTDVNVLNAEGEIVNISKMQLCLAYAYGDGRETSCQNTLTSVERLLCGMKIGNYFALDLKGIGSLNDAVGGVEVTCLETINNLCYEGEVKTLYGIDAENYVRVRDITVFNSDAGRRARQIQYTKAFVQKAKAEIKNDITKAGDLYVAAADYSCTNVDTDRFILLVFGLDRKGIDIVLDDEDIYTLPGHAEAGGKYMEYLTDDRAVLETVLKVFYKEDGGA